MKPYHNVFGSLSDNHVLDQTVAFLFICWRYRLVGRKPLIFVGPFWLNPRFIATSNEPLICNSPGKDLSGECRDVRSIFYLEATVHMAGSTLLVLKPEPMPLQLQTTGTKHGRKQVADTSINPLIHKVRHSPDQLSSCSSLLLFREADRKIGVAITVAVTLPSCPSFLSFSQDGIDSGLNLHEEVVPMIICCRQCEPHCWHTELLQYRLQIVSRTTKVRITAVYVGLVRRHPSNQFTQTVLIVDARNVEKLFGVHAGHF